MARYLIRTVETYRVGLESEAKALIEESKKDGNFTLSKYTSEYRCVKKSGEVIDDWYRVTLTKDFTAEKEPECTTTITYNTELGAFPNPVNTSNDEEERF